MYDYNTDKKIKKLKMDFEKENSLWLIENAFDNDYFLDNINGVNGSSPPDILHQYKLGFIFIKYLIKIINANIIKQEL